MFSSVLMNGWLVAFLVIEDDIAVAHVCVFGDIHDVFVDPDLSRCRNIWLKFGFVAGTPDPVKLDAILS